MSHTRSAPATRSLSGGISPTTARTGTLFSKAQSPASGPRPLDGEAQACLSRGRTTSAADSSAGVGTWPGSRQ